MLFLPEAGNFKLVKALFWANKSYSRKILIKNRWTAGWLAEKASQRSLHNPGGKDVYSVWGKENERWAECDKVSLQGEGSDGSLSSLHCRPQTFHCNSGLTGWPSSLPSPGGSECAATFCQRDESTRAIKSRDSRGSKPWEQKQRLHPHPKGSEEKRPVCQGDWGAHRCRGTMDGASPSGKRRPSVCSFWGWDSGRRYFSL